MKLKTTEEQRERRKLLLKCDRNQLVEPYPEMLDLIHDLELALGEIEQSPWQPMETLPKDGEQVLVTDGEIVVPAEWTGVDIYVHNVTCHVTLGTDFLQRLVGWMRYPDPSKALATATTLAKESE